MTLGRLSAIPGAFKTPAGDVVGMCAPCWAGPGLHVGATVAPGRIVSPEHWEHRPQGLGTAAEAEALGTGSRSLEGAGRRAPTSDRARRTGHGSELARPAVGAPSLHPGCGFGFLPALRSGTRPRGFNAGCVRPGQAAGGGPTGWAGSELWVTGIPARASPCPAAACVLGATGSPLLAP